MLRAKNIAKKHSTRQSWMCQMSMLSIQGSDINVSNSFKKPNKALIEEDIF